MFYDLYLDLCNKKGVSPTRAALEIGISKSTPTTWKNRCLTPQGETLSKIADYFAVTTDYLLGAEKEKAPTSKGERSKDPDIRRIERAKARMPETEWAKQMKVMAASFGDYFSDDYEDDDLNE